MQQIAAQAIDRARRANQEHPVQGIASLDDVRKFKLRAFERGLPGAPGTSRPELTDVTTPALPASNNYH